MWFLFACEIRRLSGPLLLSLMLLVTLPALALAHASLTGTEPKDGSVIASPPTILRISFSEPVSPTSIRLTKPDGTFITFNDSVLRDRTLEIKAPQDLGVGTLVLSWRVVSEDGHPVGGSILFSIGHPSAPPAAVTEMVDWPIRIGLWTGKIALYLGLFIGIGGIFAIHWFTQGSRCGSRLVFLMLQIGFVGTIVSAGFQGLDTAGVAITSVLEPAPWLLGLATSFGRTVAVMLVALCVSAIALRQEPGRGGRLSALIGLLIGASALCLSGHASAAEPQWLTRPAVFLHALTIAIWIGALIPLAANFKADTRSARPALICFSRTIPYVVITLAIAGIVLAIVQVREPSALLTTAYGNILLIKFGLLLILFLVAAVNRWKLTASVEIGDRVATRLFVRSIIAETVIVFLIFGVASAWRFTPPPRSLQIAAAEPASTHIHTDKAMADFSITPGRAGKVSASVLLMTGDFSPLQAQEVSIVFSNPSAGIEPIRRPTLKSENGTWKIDDLTLPVAGKWDVRIDILIDDFTIVRLDGEIDIRS